MTSFNVALVELYDEGHSVAVRSHNNSNIGAGIPSFMCMADYFFKINEFCCHGALLLNKMSAKLIGIICYCASRINEPSLNDSKNL